MTNRPIDVVWFLAASVLMSGCLAAPSAPESEFARSCEEYHISEQPPQTWNVMTNDSRPGWQAVPIAASGWRADRYEMPQEWVPSSFMDWSAYPEPDRPPLLRDAVCTHAYRIQAYPDGSASFASHVFAPEWIVHATLDALAVEHERQTGTRLDWRAGEWSILLFGDHFMEIMCRGYNARMENGSLEVDFPPRVDDDH